MAHFDINTISTGILPPLPFHERKGMTSCRATKKILLGGFIGNTIYMVIHVAKRLSCARWMTRKLDLIIHEQIRMD